MRRRKTDKNICRDEASAAGTATERKAVSGVWRTVVSEYGTGLYPACKKKENVSYAWTFSDNCVIMPLEGVKDKE